MQTKYLKCMGNLRDFITKKVTGNNFYCIGSRGDTNIMLIFSVRV